jgi:4-hydroxybenzoate polyprenyltransferase
MNDRLSAFRVLHPFPSLLVAALTVAIVPLTGRVAPLSRVVALGLGMLLYQFALGVLNDVVDLPDDRRTKPWKPLARRLLAPKFAVVAATVFAAGAAALTFSLPNHAWLIGLAGFACGAAYDFRLKRTQISWLPYAIALPLVPIWVFVACGVWRSILWWTLPLGVLLGFALQLANQAPDAGEGDRSGLPGWLGERNSRRLAVLTFAVVVAATAAVLLGSSPGRAGVASLVGATAIAASPFSMRLFGRDGLFGLLSVAGAALALVLLSTG